MPLDVQRGGIRQIFSGTGDLRICIPWKLHCTASGIDLVNLLRRANDRARMRAGPPRGRLVRTNGRDWEIGKSWTIES
jgi:hypothetical protein